MKTMLLLLACLLLPAMSYADRINMQIKCVGIDSVGAEAVLEWYVGDKVVAYKRVACDRIRTDYTHVFIRNIPTAVGSVITMPRGEACVSEDSSRCGGLFNGDIRCVEGDGVMIVKWKLSQ